MNALVVGMAMLVSSSTLSPQVEIPHDTIAPVVFTYDLPEGAAPSRNLPRRFLDDSPSVWRRESPRTRHLAAAKPYSTGERIFAIAAGACVGWLAGGAIGWVATADEDDDVSGLRGVVIGAPIGGVIGAVVGWQLTR